MQTSNCNEQVEGSVSNVVVSWLTKGKYELVESLILVFQGQK